MDLALKKTFGDRVKIAKTRIHSVERGIYPIATLYVFIHTADADADATQLDSCVASASAVCIVYNAML